MKGRTKILLCVLGATATGIVSAQTAPDNPEIQSAPSADSVVTVVEVQQIAGVAVVGKRPLVVQRQGRTIVNVDRTILADAGSLPDLLRRSPGIIVDDEDQITVFGRGKPIVYIDDREVHSPEELSSLQSTDIDRIEIIRNPSAKYSAAGHSVVRIVTKRARQDKVALMIYDNFSVSRKLGNVAGVQLDHKDRKWANLLSYSFTNTNHLAYNKSYEVNTQPGYVIRNDGDEESRYWNDAHNLFSGNEYNFNPRNRLGLQFSGNWNKGGSGDLKRQTIRRSGDGTDEADIQRRIDQSARRSNYLYNATLSYLHNPDSVNMFSLIVGYAYNKPGSIHNIAETELADGSQLYSRISNSSTYSVFSAQADKGFNLWDFAELSLGAKLSQVAQSGGSDHSDIATGTSHMAQKSDITDRIAAGYFELAGEMGDFSANAGLRYEYTSSDTRVTNAGGGAERIDTSYHSLFPSVSLDWSKGKWSTNLSYSRRIYRPSFNQINPSKAYFDALSYSMGNPFLRPVFSDNVELSATWNDLTLTADHTWDRDYIVETAVNDPENPDITRWTSVNLPRTRSFSLGLSYSRSWRVYSGSYEIELTKSYSKIPYLDGQLVLRRPYWYAAVSNTFNITKKLSLNCDFGYSSAGEEGVTYWEPSFNVQAGLVWKLADDRLTLSLYANDVLNTDNSNSWEDRYGNLVSGWRGDGDRRYIRFGVRWNFNNITSGIRRDRSNAEELNRLQ